MPDAQPPQDPQDPKPSNEPTQDLRSQGRQPKPPDGDKPDSDTPNLGTPDLDTPNLDTFDPEEGLQVMDPPEPLVVPVEELWRENDERVIKARAEAAESDAGVHIHVAEYIKVRGYGQVFDFMGLHMGTYRQARKLDGFSFGGIKGRWWVKKFWTYTVWRSRASMEAYVAGRLHANMVSRLPELAAPGSCYVEWEGTGNPDWPEALRRLERPTRYYVDPFAR